MFDLPDGFGGATKQGTSADRRPAMIATAESLRARLELAVMWLFFWFGQEFD
ncbi:hypothetical protein HZA57_00240 [Candidatus Poribacteria bacterium]|nr:hypothetical protein [Candidatus Poribacteria bacterium]